MRWSEITRQTGLVLCAALTETNATSRKVGFRVSSQDRSCRAQNAPPRTEYKQLREKPAYSRRKTIAVASSLSVPPLANSCTSVNTDLADTPGFCKNFTRREVPYSWPSPFVASTAPSVYISTRSPVRKVNTTSEYSEFMSPKGRPFSVLSSVMLVCSRTSKG